MVVTLSSAASVSNPVPSLPSPVLIHSLGDENKSVLSLVADAEHVYVGGQCQDISVGPLYTNYRQHAQSRRSGKSGITHSKPVCVGILAVFSL